MQDIMHDRREYTHIVGELCYVTGHVTGAQRERACRGEGGGALQP